MRLLVASRNRDKIAELRHALRGLDLEITSALEWPGVAEVEETGATLEENALLKARAVQRATGEAALADDTGLEVDALNGAPGVASARFAGPEQSYARNLDKLLGLMQAVPLPRRTARFRTVAALRLPDGREWVLEGVCEGTILPERRGTSGFGYDPVFFVPALGKTFAELTLDEKNEISHRGRAMRKVHELLASLLQP
ncbi:MAG: XTP/dITP diphosphatase [Candidatus Eisenbacteria bacterium]|nr:XTP/dITP diphosphatase [Candidatus Eisenbacteria bacterium]